jgi:hypothetical protein
MDRNEISTLYRAPPIYVSYQVSVDLAKQFQKSTNLTKKLPVVSMFVNGSKRNEHLYRGPSIDASYQDSCHVAKRFRRKIIFRNRPIGNKNCLIGGHVC